MNLKALAGLGINEKASSIYLAGLTLGTTSIQNLARKAGLKRPTVYVQMEELLQQGFFIEQKVNKKHLYMPVDPTILEKRLGEQLESLREELPRLVTLRSEAQNRPQVLTVEGIDQMKEIYEEAMRANSLRVWSNVGKTFHIFQDQYVRLAEQVRQSQVTVREIVADNKDSKRYARYIKNIAGPTYAVRGATVDGLENDSFLFGDVLVLFRLHEFNMFAVRIEDPTVADTFRALFDMAWKSAKSL